MDGPWIVKNVKNVSVSSDLQIEDCGAYINCPNCGYRNDNRNVKKLFTISVMLQVNGHVQGEHLSVFFSGTDSMARPS